MNVNLQNKTTSWAIALLYSVLFVMMIVSTTAAISSDAIPFTIYSPIPYTQDSSIIAINFNVPATVGLTPELVLELSPQIELDIDTPITLSTTVFTASNQISTKKSSISLSKRVATITTQLSLPTYHDSPISFGVFVIIPITKALSETEGGEIAATVSGNKLTYAGDQQFFPFASLTPVKEKHSQILNTFQLQSHGNNSFSFEAHVVETTTALETIRVDIVADNNPIIVRQRLQTEEPRPCKLAKKDIFPTIQNNALIFVLSEPLPINSTFDITCEDYIFTTTSHQQKTLTVEADNDHTTGILVAIGDGSAVTQSTIVTTFYQAHITSSKISAGIIASIIGLCVVIIALIVIIAIKGLCCKQTSHHPEYEQFDVQ